MLAVALFGSLLAVVVNGTVADGVPVDRATLLWQLGIASSVGIALGLLLPAHRRSSRE